MLRGLASAFVIAGVSAQFGGHAAYGGGHQGVYGAYGLNRGSEGTLYGRGARGDLSQGASAYHGLGGGDVHQETHGQIVGGRAVGGYGNSNGIQKHFSDQKGVQDHFSNGHNRVFSKEKVYSVDQAYGQGGQNAYGATDGHHGGYGQDSAYHSEDHGAENRAAGFGARSGHSNGGYHDHIDHDYGSHDYGHRGGQQLNSYGNHGGESGYVGLPYGGYGSGPYRYRAGGYLSPHYGY